MDSRVAALLARLRRWWSVEEPDGRISGSGEVYLDPAYNSQYTAERRLNQLAKAQANAAPRELDVEAADAES